MSKLLILGAGGLGQMVGEVARAAGNWDGVAFLDDAVRGADVAGKCMDYTSLTGEYPEAVAAFGDNRLRLAWTRRLLDAGYRVPSVVHPTAIVSPSAVLGPGCLVLHGAIINTNTVLGAACLVNSGALVDHDNVLEDGVHVNLHATIKAWCHMEPCARTEAATVLYSTRRHIDGVEDHNLEDALFAFKLGETASYVKPFGAGHINDTYAVYMAAQGGDELRYVIQRINTGVFKDPRAVMENIFGVTEYLRRKILARGGDADRETLNYIKTKTGDNYFEDAVGSAWRCYNYIPDSVCIESVTDPMDFYHSAKSFGGFLRALEDYPAGTLHETIEKFHDTRKRLADFDKALERDVKNRARTCREEIAFVQRRRADCAVLMDLLDAGKLPLRVTHNDTKLNNILFDAHTGEALCVIDLDTIMPGLALNDYGDSIRFGASTAAEDEPDVSKVHFDLYLFELYTRGYLEAAGAALTDTEKDLIRYVKANFPKVILIVNSSNAMELAEVNAPKTEDNLGVDAILWVGHTGNDGAAAIGNILSGKVSPSGRTADTYAVDFTKDPTFTNFGSNGQNFENGERMNNNVYVGDTMTDYHSVEYREGIYVGYRYYETKGHDAGEAWYDENVVYPFGYGLSYTTFQWNAKFPENAVISRDTKIDVEVTVTNTGSVAGKDVVELYASTPYLAGEIEKAHVVLAGFAKTKLLAPGE